MRRNEGKKETGTQRGGDQEREGGRKQKVSKGQKEQEKEKKTEMKLERRNMCTDKNRNK